MQHKTFDLLEVKADGEAGEFTALASVFGNVDLVGDRMLPGSFKRTLKKWRKSGDPIPVVLSHDWDDPMKYVGSADPRAVIETEKGLLVQGKLDIANGNAVADQVYKLMKQRLLKGWSFGYTVPEGGQKLDDEGVNEVSEVDLFEVGPTLKGANPEALTQGIKSALEVDDPPPLTLLQEIERAELPQDVKDRMTAKAEEILQKAIEDAEGEEPDPAKPEAQDPLSKRHDRLQYELVTAGIPPAHKPPQVTEPPPELDTDALQREYYDLMLNTLIGSENP
jgi:HK97 family phage prohead protease